MKAKSDDKNKKITIQLVRRLLWVRGGEVAISRWGRGGEGGVVVVNKVCFVPKFKHAFIP